jgi:predicted phosphodiesterase
MKTGKINPPQILISFTSICLLLIGFMQIQAHAPMTSTEAYTLGDDTLTVIAVGDIACAPYDEGYNDGNGSGELCRHKAVAEAIKKEKHIDALLLLGDIQYQKGELEYYYSSLAPAWGNIRAGAVLAVPGNHDWANGSIDNYQTAMPSIFPTLVKTSIEKPYFTWDKSGWKFIGLDSDCLKIGGCSEEEPQSAWLKQALKNDPKPCTLAFWHHPVFNSGQHRTDGTNQYMRPAWSILDRFGADLVLAGHEHAYERFAQQSLSPLEGEGIRQIMVGTGGRNLYDFVEPYETGHEVGVRDFGYLKLKLRKNSYSWQFIDIHGVVRDRGSSACHN